MSSSNFSEELLDVIEAMIVNAGGTVPPLREMNFNDRLLALLGALAPFVGASGGGGGGGGNATSLNGQPGSFYANRVNHTGVQAIETVSGLRPALDSLGNATAAVSNGLAEYRTVTDERVGSLETSRSQQGTQINGLLTSVGNLSNTVGQIPALSNRIDQVEANTALDPDLAAIAGLSTTSFGRSLLTGADAAAVRNAIGAQPQDSDLTAIAGLTTQIFGRSLLTMADGPAARSAIGAQAQDADLDAIAALTTTAYGRSLLTLTQPVAMQSDLPLASPEGLLMQAGGVYGPQSIQVSPGRAVIPSDTARAIASLGSITRKLLSQPWAEGDGVGGRLGATAPAANQQWNVFLLRNRTTGAVDVGLGLSNAPGLTGWDGRIIGSVLLDGSANIRPFSQSGDYFYWNGGIDDIIISNAPSGAPGFYPISAPGVVGARAIAAVTLSHPSADSLLTVNGRRAGFTHSGRSAFSQFEVFVNASRNVSIQTSVANTAIHWITLGFIHARGTDFFAA